MPDSIGFDYVVLNHLAADMGRVPAIAGPLIVKALQVSAGKMKETWRQSAREKDKRHARGYPFAIDYDIVNNSGAFAPTAVGGAANQVEAIIGPNLAKNQGSFGFLESSPGGVRSAPQNNARRAVAENVGDFEKGILQAGADAIERSKR